MAEGDEELRIRIARARLLAEAPDKGGAGTAVAEPPPDRPTYPVDPAVSHETRAIWGGGDPADAVHTPPEVRSRRMQGAIHEEGRQAFLRQTFADMSIAEKQRAAASINEGRPERKASWDFTPEEMALEHLRLRGTSEFPVTTEALRTASDVVSSPEKVYGTGRALLYGDTEEAKRALTARTPGEPDTFTLPGERSPNPVERGLAQGERMLSNPLSWFGMGAAEATASGLIRPTGRGLTSAEVQGFRDVREEALAALQKVREERQVGRVASHVESVPSLGDLAGSARADEAAESLRRLGASGPELNAALQKMETDRLLQRFGTGNRPPEVAPQVALPGETAKPPAGASIEVPTTLQGGASPAMEQAKRDYELSLPGQRVRLTQGPEAGKEGVVRGVQPNGTLLISVEGGRPALTDPAGVELLNRPAVVKEPLPESANAPIGTYPLAKSETGLQTVGEARGGPPAVQGPDGPLPGAPVHPVPSGIVPALARDPSVPHPTWTRAVDAVTEGVGSWMDLHFPGTMQALRSATAESPYAASDRALGALHETYLSNLGRLRGQAKDVLGPAEKALGKAKPTPEETEAFFRYASGRSTEVPQIVKDHHEIGKALDWYNTVLRPELVKRGALSKDALEEFDRYLPNILTAEIEKPGRRSFAFTGAPRASVPRLRQNHPGAILENVTRDEAQALADSLKGTTAEPVVVGPYGRNSYIKYASAEDRDAFVKALESERRGAGLKTGKIRYQTFEKIPDAWLERSVEEGGGGLVKDPMGLLAHAMDRGTKEIAARDFYAKLAEHPAVADLEAGQAPARGFAAVPDTPRWGDLRGKQVPEDWMKALQSSESWSDRVLPRWWTGTIRAFKKNVILQTATASRNGFYDANTLAVYNHMSPGSPAFFRSIGKSVKAHREWIATKVRPEAVRAFQEGGGLLNGDVLSSEALDRLNALLKAQKEGKVTVEQAAEEFTHLTTGSPYALQGAEDASGIRSAARSVSGGATAGARSLAQGEGLGEAAVKAAEGAGQTMALGKAAKVGQNIYGGTDDFFKIAYFENWRAEFRAAHPELPPATIDRLAAREVNARSQLAQFKSPIARELTDSGVLPFAWWWDQKARIESYMFKQDPVRFAIGQGQGTAFKVVAGTAVAATTGIPVAMLWDWMKRNPGSIPLSAHKDEGGKWIVVGSRYQAALPDPVAYAMASAQDPGGAVKEAGQALAFSNPVSGFVARAGALSTGGTEAIDPTYGDHRKILRPGETPAAAALRLYQESFGSPISPTGRQSEDVRALAEGDQFKGKTQPRTAGRTAAGLAGATISESPAASAEFAGRRYAAEHKDADAWVKDAMRDPDARRLAPDDPERARIWREYDHMTLDAYEEALQGGATPAPPQVHSPEGVEKLKAILAHHQQPVGASR